MGKMYALVKLYLVKIKPSDYQCEDQEIKVYQCQPNQFNKTLKKSKPYNSKGKEKI